VGHWQLNRESERIFDGEVARASSVDTIFAKCIGLCDRAIGRMFRQTEAREEDAVLRDVRGINDKVHCWPRSAAC
jgi:hypothetical protein